MYFLWLRHLHVRAEQHSDSKLPPLATLLAAATLTRRLPVIGDHLWCDILPGLRSFNTQLKPPNKILTLSLPPSCTDKILTFARDALGSFGAVRIACALPSLPTPVTSSLKSDSPTRLSAPQSLINADVRLLPSQLQGST